MAVAGDLCPKLDDGVSFDLLLDDPTTMDLRDVSCEAYRGGSMAGVVAARHLASAVCEEHDAPLLASDPRLVVLNVSVYTKVFILKSRSGTARERQ